MRGNSKAWARTIQRVAAGAGAAAVGARARRIVTRCALVAIVLGVVYQSLPYKLSISHGHLRFGSDAAAGRTNQGCTSGFPYRIAPAGWGRFIVCRDATGMRLRLTNISAYPVALQTVVGNVVYWDPQLLAPAELVEYEAQVQALKNGSFSNYHPVLPGRTVEVLPASTRYQIVPVYRPSMVEAAYFAADVVNKLEGYLVPWDGVISREASCAAALGQDVAPAPTGFASPQTAISKHLIGALWQCRDVSKWLAANAKPDVAWVRAWSVRSLRPPSWSDVNFEPSARVLEAAQAGKDIAPPVTEDVRAASTIDRAVTEAQLLDDGFTLVGDAVEAAAR